MILLRGRPGFACGMKTFSSLESLDKMHRKFKPIEEKSIQSVSRVLDSLEGKYRPLGRFFKSLDWSHYSMMLPGRSVAAKDTKRNLKRISSYGTRQRPV